MIEFAVYFLLLMGFKEIFNFNFVFIYLLIHLFLIFLQKQGPNGKKTSA